MSDTDDTKKPADSAETPAPNETDATRDDEKKASATEEAAESDVSGGEVVKKKPAKEPLPAPPTMMQWVFLAIVAIATAGVDLWSKSWAIRRLSMPSPRAVPLCTPPPGAQHYLYQRVPQNQVVLSQNYLEFRYTENCGGAWGLLHGASEKIRRPFFFLITILAIGFIVHLYRTLEKDQRAMRLALPLVLGGAIGNLVDRLRLGYVVDFILMHWKEKFHWPTYNVADIAITIGIALMIFEFIFGAKPAETPKKSEKKSEKKSDEAPAT